jgi:hypothetical protein
MKLTVSDSLNATTAGVTRSPASFAITSIFESYTQIPHKFYSVSLLLVQHETYSIFQKQYSSSIFISYAIMS